MEHPPKRCTGGEPRPILTAPTERLDLRDGFVICKHLKVVSERILPSVQHNIVKILRQRTVEESKKKAPSSAPPSKRELEMRQRQEKNRKAPAPNKSDVRKQLEKGLENRNTVPKNDVVERDTLATQEEKQRIPVLPSKPGPPPPPLPVADKEEADPIFPDPDPEPEKAPPSPSLQPQRMPKLNENDRSPLQKLLREEQKRQNDKTQQRLRTNPRKR